MARRAIVVRRAYDQAMARSAVDWQQVLHRCPASATAPESPADRWDLVEVAQLPCRLTARAKNVVAGP
jgi:hypothetical protein